MTSNKKTDAGKLFPGTLYLGDNGRCFCGTQRCSGATAFFSGHDISGQPVEAITAAELKDAADQGYAFHCEGCGRKAN